MNISPKFLQNNGLSGEKKFFYENLPSRYSKISQDYNKKSVQEHSNFSKKVLTWLFNQNEDTRMLLCSVENKKYTNTIFDAYSYLVRHEKGVKFLFSEEDNKDEDKFKFEVISSEYDKYFRNNNNVNSKENRNPYYNANNNLNEMKIKDDEFLNNIIFYQSESTVEDIDNYSSYFTLKKEFLKNEEIFKNCCNILSYNSFLSAPIMTKKDVQSVQNKTIVTLGLPVWITNEIQQKQIMNYEDENNFNYNFDETNNNKYFTLSQYCLALIEQVLCVRYLLYTQNKNMNDIISSIYLKDLLSKKDLMIEFLNTSDYDTDKFYEKFNINEINTRVFYDENIEKFIKEKNLFNEVLNDQDKYNYSNIYYESQIKLKIFENEETLEGLSNIYENNKNKFNKEVINKFTFFNINKLYTYEDFANRIIFEKIFEEYSKKIWNDLINDDEKKAKKKKRKKKKNNIENSKINVNEIKEKENEEKNKEIIYNFIKNLIYDKLNKKLNELNNKNDNNKNNQNYKKEKNKKEKEFFLYQPTNNKKKKGNNKKSKNNNNNNNKNNSNKKENINIIKEENMINSDNNISNNPTENKKEYKEDMNIINIEEKNEIIKEKKDKSPEKLLKNNNIIINTIEIQSHINSFTLSSSTNSSTSSDSLNYKLNPKTINKNEIYDNNNLFVVHQNPIISYQKFAKLNKDIIDFNNDLESLLIILREIKYEIKYHFDYIIRKVYKEAKLDIYGSSLYKLDIETSDLDLSICSEEQINLDDLVTYLNNINEDKKYLNINFIKTASIPIIKIDVDFLKLNNRKIKELIYKLNNNNYYKFCVKNNFYNDTNIIKVDISLNSINYKQLNFINQGIKQFPQIIFLIKILKKLLLYKHMSNSYKGGMSSYCLFLIIYSYLKMYFSFYSNNPLDNNYGSFLIGFLFHYVMCIDLNYTIINPLMDNPFIIYTCPIEVIPTIIEPTTLKNAGKNIYRIFDVITTLNEIYRDIYIVIKKDYNDGSNNYIYELFKNYVKSG